MDYVVSQALDVMLDVNLYIRELLFDESEVYVRYPTRL